MERSVISRYRNEFPVTGKFIYLDHAGVAPISRRVEKAVSGFAAEMAENGAFLYPEWSQKVAGIRKRCAELIHAKDDEVAFVRSTSHGLSLVAEGIKWNKGENVLIYEKEFPSNLYPWEHIQRKGVEVRRIPSKNGCVLLEDIEELMDQRTRLLSLSTVQFTNGFRIDLARTGALCRKRKVLFCVDAIQSLGIIPMDVRECGIDFLSADAHKWLLGPEGIGMFYCRREIAEQLEPALVGWKSVKQEFSFERPDYELKTNALRFEEGSMNLLGIFGLGAAIELLNEVGIENIHKRILDLGEIIIQEAEKRGFVIRTPKERNARGGNITVSGQFDPEKLRNELRARGIMVNVRAGGLRISPHFYNTADEIIACFKQIDNIRETSK